VRLLYFSLQPKKLRMARMSEATPQMVRSVKGVVVPAARAKSPA
jgi:hypothetical protein